MATESKLQGTVSRWLKSKGCVVLTLSPTPGVPTGFPDILALLPGGGYVALELKAAAHSKKQALQEHWIEKLDEMYYARFIWPENWDEIKVELERLI